MYRISVKCPTKKKRTQKLENFYFREIKKEIGTSNYNE